MTKKVTIFLRSSQVVVHMSNDEEKRLLEQIYDLFDGEIKDNCLEVVAKDENGKKETTLIKGDEVLYASSKDLNYE